MDKFIIRGGTPLRGHVSISGAKNAALPIIAASILTDQPVLIHNVPRLRDIYTMGHILQYMGANHHFDEDNRAFHVHLNGMNRLEAPYEMVKTMRASILFLGPMVARYRQARVSLPGGCAIGARPVNLHLDALRKMGVEINIVDGYIEAHCQELRGADIYFDTVTVTGTENIMMAATLAKGRTVLKNAAREPEVVDLARCLVHMGAHIEGIGSDTLTIEGVDELAGACYSVMPDRIEAGTFMAAAAITAGEVTLPATVTPLVESIIMKLQDCDIRIQCDDEYVRVYGNGITCRDMVTSPYPGFPTDMQAQYMALMCRGQGVSIIEETIFENRYMHVAELQRMGADIEVQGSRAVIKGQPFLKGAPVMATDLRASASLVIAALAARGSTEIQRIYHLDRGYDHIEDKLTALGASIERVQQ
ncbi:UDP-N-acetylglucosamine 1-carboxyvinyltransferase [Desulfurispira natronophila]|uniref:UDP-N-acetylglucosamine 1-carboxyvinyltransferase n=1 Tax=Desulfurispira natronophila TaxID=682562 RepID=A0A7W7Y4U0_9BACT|nr:UDP-N-acetylglucosamine 1-carboxyvinyltransferase [Desulfurispira natronophila]MBB5021807.1 UDP-N-acetylglucosamine 1-carboxyvinyltransferase [Desulfurispira natronophila]